MRLPVGTNSLWLEIIELLRRLTRLLHRAQNKWRLTPPRRRFTRISGSLAFVGMSILTMGNNGCLGCAEEFGIPSPIANLLTSAAWGVAGFGASGHSSARSHPETLERVTPQVTPRITGTDGSQTGTASFQGNFTTITEPSQSYFLMYRNPDCSLTLVEGNSGLAGSANITTATTNYEQTLHQLASLTTTPDVFPHGCAEGTTGISSRVGIAVEKVVNGPAIFATAEGNSNNNAVFVQSTSGDLSTGALTVLPGTTAATALMTADFNGDGHGDLVVVNGYNATSGYVSILLGKGDGTFQPAVNYPTAGNYSVSAVVDDLNGDGKLDIVSISGDQQISVLLGNGDGTFQAAKSFAAPALPGPASLTATPIFNLITADLRGNNKKDLIASNGLVLLSDGDGTFTPAAAAAFPYPTGTTNEGPNLASGDLNNDGKLDLVLSSSTGISTWIGKGDGSFTAGSTYSSIDDTGYVTVSDLDGDGNADIYTGLSNYGVYSGDDSSFAAAYVLLGHGDGTFSGAPTIAGSYTGNNLGDVNGDALPDIITNGHDQFSNPLPTLIVQLGSATGLFHPGSTITAPASFSLGGQTITGANTVGVSTFAVGDINGDGKADLVFADNTLNDNNTSGYPVPVYFTALSNGDGTFATPVANFVPQIAPAADYDMNLTVAGLQIANVTGSGHKDLIFTFADVIGGTGVTSPYVGGFVVLPGNGDGTFKAPIITTTSSSATTQFYEPPLQIVSTADLNGDGKADLLATAGTGTVGVTQLELYLSNGDGTFKAPAAIATAANPGLIFQEPCTLADVNKDGKLDLMCLGETSASQAQLAISLGKGDGTFGTPTTLNIGGGDAIRSSGIGAADFDGDGNVDIALLDANDFSGIFYGKGDGTFTSVPLNGNSIPKDLINLNVGGVTVAVDLTGKGKPDLLAGDSVLLNIYGAAPIVTPTLASTTTALTASAATITAGGSVTFTATITGASGSTGVPTGSVTFLDGTTSLGTGTLNASGVATLSTTKLSAGTQSITAQYGGDTNFAGSVSTAVTVTVTAPVPPSFSLSASPTSFSIAAGQGGTTTLSVTPAGGFAQAVSFACSGLPSEATCGFSPATVTPAATAATTTLTITTTAAHIAKKSQIYRSGMAGFWTLASLLLFALPATRRAARYGRYLALIMALTLSGVFIGCGGGGSSGGGNSGPVQPTDPGTPAGVSTVTVTATAGSLSQTATLQVTVSQ